MVGTRLPILLALTISSLSAELVTVNLSGVTTGGEYVVTQNAYSGLYSGLPASHYGYGFAGFYNSLESYTNVNGELLLTTSYLTGGGADLVITSAVTAGYHPADTDPSAVPEPSTLALAAIGSVLVAFRGLRRN